MDKAKLLELLTANIAVAQFFAYTALTVTTAIVAILSLRFSYRQHYGWRPILLLVTRGLKVGRFEEASQNESDDEKQFGPSAWITFDLWNRHTYPIVVEGVSVSFSQDILDYSKQGRRAKGEQWVLMRNAGYIYQERFVLDNGNNHTFELNARLKEAQSLDAIDGRVSVTIRYFDPRKKKRKRLEIREPYNFKSLEAKRAKLIRKARSLLGMQSDTRGQPDI